MTRFALNAEHKVPVGSLELFVYLENSLNEDLLGVVDVLTPQVQNLCGVVMTIYMLQNSLCYFDIDVKYFLIQFGGCEALYVKFTDLLFPLSTKLPHNFFNFRLDFFLTLAFGEHRLYFTVMLKVLHVLLEV